MRSSLVALLLLVAVGCGNNNSPGVDAPVAPVDAPAIDAPVIDAPAIDAPAVDAEVDAFAPAVITLTGGANGLRWDAASSTLYLTDSVADALLRYTDAGGVQTVGTLPTASMGISLGDIVKRADGSFIIPNFGFGQQGAFFQLSSTNVAATLTGPAVNRRRIGLDQDSSGQLYVGYFIGGGSGTPTGGLASVAITAGAAVETDLATSLPLKKVVGLVATPTALFVTDQTDKLLYKVALPGGAVTTVATLPSADLLIMLPNGDLLTGGNGLPAGTNGVHRITQAGVVTTIMTGFEQVRGLAYDPALHRLFIIEHSATVGVPDKLHIRPLAD